MVKGSLLLLLFVCLTPFASATIVRGTTYAWDTFEPVPRPVIKVYSLGALVASTVGSNDGNFSIELLPGNYTFVFLDYQNRTLVFSVEENVTVLRPTGFVNMDVIMFPPPVEENVSETNESVVEQPIEVENKTMVNDSNMSALGNASVNDSTMAIVDQRDRLINQLLFFFLLTLIGFTALFIHGMRGRIVSQFPQYASRKYMELRKATAPKTLSGFSQYTQRVKDAFSNLFSGLGLYVKNSWEKIGPGKKSKVSVSKETRYSPQAKLPEELEEVLEVVHSSGGEILQKDLKKSIDFSPAKISLMVKDLVRRGYLKKIKKGRKNVLTLK